MRLRPPRMLRAMRCAMPLSASGPCGAAAPSSPRAPQDVSLPIDPAPGAARPLGRDADLTDEQTTEIREAYDLFDTTGTNAVPRHQLKHIMRSLGIEVRKETLARLQLGKTGPLTFEEFLALMRQITVEGYIQEEMMAAFNRFDIDGKGKITFENLRAVAEQLGETISEEELREMIKEADVDKDGVVNASEFVRIMKKTDVWVNHSPPEPSE